MFLITLLYFLLEVLYKPSVKKGENARNIISNGIYTLTNLLFLVLHFSEGKITLENKELFIGWPLIISVSILIISNYYISTKKSMYDVKKRCKSLKKNKIAQKNAKCNKSHIENE